MINSDTIKRLARDAGFTLCGIARARMLTEHAEPFAAGLAASGERVLHYLADRPQRRLDPSCLVAGARTVISCAVDYRNFYSGGYPAGFANPKVCSYALSTEYQPKIKAMLTAMLGRLRETYPAVSGRAFCDTSAILEKAWATEAGLGWIGRNSLLVNPDYGSFLLLGELVVDADCDAYDTPYEGVGCGECRRCVDGCPAQAVAANRTIDTGRCISRLTIEKTAGQAAPAELHGWIYGCDECQSVCPYNRPRGNAVNPNFAPVFDPANFSAERWRNMTENEFRSLFDGTPLPRTGLDRIKKMLPMKK